MMKILAHVLFVVLVFSFCSCATEDQTERTYSSRLQYSTDRDFSLLLHNGEILEVSGKLLIIKGDTLTLQEAATEIILGQPYEVTCKGEQYTFYRSNLPIISIDTDDKEMNKWSKIDGQISIIDDGDVDTYHMGIELRGGTSVTFEKKSFTFELRDEDGNQISRPLLDMRDEDDWIIDALYNEPLRIRDYVAHDIWLSMGRTPELGPDKIRTGIAREYVEVFVNGSYRGIAYLGEKYDRKQLDLKDYNGSMESELYKGHDWGNGNRFKSVDAYDDNEDTWSGYEVKYPEEDGFSWANLQGLVSFVVNNEGNAFDQAVAQYLDLDNMVDYFLFINAIYAEDNHGKNVYTVRYAANEPYFFLPWDLDGTSGRNWQGLESSDTESIVSSNLFDKLLANTVFVSKLKARWQQLRSLQLAPQTINTQFVLAYENLKKNGAYEREALNADLPFHYSDDEIDYITAWVQRKYDFLDLYINGL